MSYILDALRRADADRSRGAVPGLHTQQSTQSADALAHPPRHSPLPWLLGAVALALVGAAGWWFGGGSQSRAPSSAAALQPERTIVQLPVAAPGPASPPPAPAPLIQPPAVTVAPAVAPAPQPPLEPSAKPVAVAVPKAAEPTPPAPPPRAERAAAPDAPARIPTPAELPAAIRQQLPALAINGATYSRNPAHRMLVVEGHVYGEGDKLGPDWTLEEIGPKAVVLNYRGHRYQVAL